VFDYIQFSKFHTHNGDDTLPSFNILTDRSSVRTFHTSQRNSTSVPVTLNTSTQQPMQVWPTVHRTFLFHTRRPAIQPTEIEILYSGSVTSDAQDLCMETRGFTLNYLFFFNTFNRHEKYDTDPSTARREIAERVGLHFYSTHTPSWHEKRIPRT